MRNRPVLTHLRRAPIVFLVVLLSCTNQNEESIFPLEQYLNYGLQEGFPGIIIGVYDLNTNTTFVESKGYAHLESKRLMKPDEKFHVGSVTKLITAVATLQLIEKGLLDYETKVLDVLEDSVIYNIPYIQEITVKNLLNHTSGIYGSNNDLTYIGSLLGENSGVLKKWSSLELLALSDSSRVKPFGKPNSGTHYGDANYILLELIIQNITGKSLRQYVDENIFQALQLQYTAYFGLADNKDKVEMTPTTHGYIKKSPTIESILKIADRFTRVQDSLINTTEAVDLIDGAAAIVSTAEDLLKLTQHIYEGELLANESINFIKAPATKVQQSEIGAMDQGIVQVFKQESGILFASTGDGTSGFHNIVAYHPDKRVIISVYANIFGLFNEKETMLKIIDDIIRDHF